MVKYGKKEEKVMNSYESDDSPLIIYRLRVLMKILSFLYKE